MSLLSCYEGGLVPSSGEDPMSGPSLWTVGTLCRFSRAWKRGAFSFQLFVSSCLCGVLTREWIHHFTATTWRFTPLKINMNLKITQLKRKILFQTSIFGFQVTFPGYIYFSQLHWCSSKIVVEILELCRKSQFESPSLIFIHIKNLQIPENSKQVWIFSKTKLSQKWPPRFLPNWLGQINRNDRLFWFPMVVWIKGKPGILLEKIPLFDK